MWAIFLNEIFLILKIKSFEKERGSKKLLFENYFNLINNITS